MPAVLRIEDGQCERNGARRRLAEAAIFGGRDGRRADRVGLVGYGLAGSVLHAPLIQVEDRLRLQAVASQRPDRVHGGGGADPARQAPGPAAQRLPEPALGQRLPHLRALVTGRPARSGLRLRRPLRPLPPSVRRRLAGGGPARVRRPAGRRLTAGVGGREPGSRARTGRQPGGLLAAEAGFQRVGSCPISSPRAGLKRSRRHWLMATRQG